jgi:hypothetical protein
MTLLRYIPVAIDASSPLTWSGIARPYWVLSEYKVPVCRLAGAPAVEFPFEKALFSARADSVLKLNNDDKSVSSSGNYNNNESCTEKSNSPELTGSNSGISNISSSSDSGTETATKRARTGE